MKTPKKSKLNSQIEKTVTTDHQDGDINSYLKDLFTSINGLSELPNFSLLTKKDSELTIEICNQRLAELAKLQKQVSALKKIVK